MGRHRLVTHMKTQLLVSVRSAEEAQAALAGGAALIDVKEPARGSLGRADLEVIRAVVDVVAGRQPVSAALGEWADQPSAIPALGLSYVKWGLAGCSNKSDWKLTFGLLLKNRPRPQLVLAAYADWECAQAPPLEEIFALASEVSGSVMLVDTHCKDARLGKHRATLLDWISVHRVVDLCKRARRAEVRIALAGSLGQAEIRELLPAHPDWFAVRGAACGDGDRRGTIEVERVKELAALCAG